MVRESLPIKCMEAVILAIYLTNGIPGLGRFPINFKSEVNEASLLRGRKYYYHVVLGVAYKVNITKNFVNLTLVDGSIINISNVTAIQIIVCFNETGTKRFIRSRAQETEIMIFNSI